MLFFVFIWVYCICYTYKMSDSKTQSCPFVIKLFFPIIKRLNYIILYIIYYYIKKICINDMTSMLTNKLCINNNIDCVRIGKTGYVHLL